MTSRQGGPVGLKSDTPARGCRARASLHLNVYQEGKPLPSKTGLIDPSDSVLLMVDHQRGLLQVVNDPSISELRTNVAVLTKAATLARVPVIATASVPEGPKPA
jgi:isochorismate hydrolase